MFHDRHRPGPHHRRQGTQGFPLAKLESRTASGSRKSASNSTRFRPAVSNARRRPPRCSTRQTGLRLHAGGHQVFILEPMIANGEEPTGSMGNDSALPVLSSKLKPFYLYFKAALRAGDQPADRPDPRGSGDVAGVVHRAEAEPARRLRTSTRRSASKSRSRCCPSATSRKIRHIEKYTGGKFRSHELNICYPVAWGPEGIEARVASLTAEAEDAGALGRPIF